MKDFDNRLENLFSQRRMQTENSEMPLGHQERFLEKLEGRNTGLWHRIAAWFNDQSTGKKAAWILSPAICAIAIVLLMAKTSPEDSLARMEQRYRLSLMEMGKELTEDSHSLSEGFKEDALYSISSITEDDEFLALQLPANLSKKEKQKIIKEYYNQKMEGLKKIKTFIAMNDGIEE
ncbi:MAG: hypothetical protein IJG54_08770 [Bacteroidales bacterium]|nr:hypothetical protein [Bacteroidales bacterium]